MSELPRFILHVWMERFRLELQAQVVVRAVEEVVEVVEAGARPQGYQYLELLWFPRISLL